MHDRHTATMWRLRGIRCGLHGATRTLATLVLCAVATDVHARRDAFPTHPLSPLTALEMEQSRAVLERAGKLTPDVRFATVQLREPRDKQDVLNFVPGRPFSRLIDSVLYSEAKNTAYEGTVELPRGTLVGWRERPGVQTLSQREDDESAAAIIRADPGWQEVLRARPDIDAKKVSFSALGNGPFVAGAQNGAATHRRFLVVVFQGDLDVPGLTIHVDLTARKVLRYDVAAYEAIRPLTDPLPEPSAPGVDAILDAHRKGPRPVVSDSDSDSDSDSAPSFRVADGEVTWDKWRFRFGVTPREGLVLHQAAFRDGERYRSILYRGSLSEMVVPYGSPDRNWYWRNIFDAGLVGMAIYGARSRLPGGDDPYGAAYFDAVVNDSAGRPIVVPRAVSLRERDGGTLWRHGVASLHESMDVAGQRARQLVLSYYATIGNYDYGWNWIFHRDGTLELDIELTGIVNVRRAFRPREAAGYPDPQFAERYFGTIVSPHLEAVNHQHFFSFRLDVDVDGPARDSVAEMNVHLAPLGPENPYGNAFFARMTELPREQDAQRSQDASQSRHWLAINRGSESTLGHEAAYALMPGMNTVPLAPPGSVLREQAGFLDHHFWATPYDADELYAAGDYPLQGPVRDGLTSWTRANRDIDSTDIVLWHTVGVSHVPRPEEWPLMSVHHLGFKLVPWGFFTRNPAFEP